MKTPNPAETLVFLAPVLHEFLARVHFKEDDDS
jgi:hypothetical protein